MPRSSRVNPVVVTQRFRSRTQRIDEAEPVELSDTALVRCVRCKQTVTVKNAVKVDETRWACRACIAERMARHG